MGGSCRASKLGPWRQAERFCSKLIMLEVGQRIAQTNKHQLLDIAHRWQCALFGPLAELVHTTTS